MMITKTTKTDIKNKNLKSSDKQEFNEDYLSPNNLKSQGDLSFIQNFDKMDSKEMYSMLISSKQENLSTEKDFNIVVDEINNFIYKMNNIGNDAKLEKQEIIEYFKNYSTSSQEIYYWLLNNQNNSNSIFLLGYFNYYGIETNNDYKKAFNLFINASEKNCILAQYFVGKCYQYGFGAVKSEKFAFKYFEKVANKNYAMGQLEIGICYKFGIGVKEDHNKAFELFKQSAEGGYSKGIMLLGYCYKNGLELKLIDKKHLNYTKVLQI
jgi:TPR repeat protein